jgi:alkylation response protein AidB-like acyl-CoA dehydrogenase
VDLDDTPEQATYRATVRAWLGEHAREAPTAGPDGRLDPEAWRRWQGRLAEGGLVAVTWPAEYGGQGLGPIEQVIVGQELARATVPGPMGVIGLGMCGPALIYHGTDDQRRHLPALLSGEEHWSQLFSEPAAGSDVAGIQTRATELDDGSWSITGQKVWTTGAQHSDWGILIARTDPDVPKHKGLTMFIVPIKGADGVTVRPLRQILGDAEFNEVFFDGLRVPQDAVLGGAGNGWTVALTVLMHERLSIGAGNWGSLLDDLIGLIAGDEDAGCDAVVRQRLGAVAAELLALRFTGYRMLTAVQQGRIPGPEAGLAKVTTVNASAEAYALALAVLGPDGLEERSPWGTGAAGIAGFRSAGGSEQILRNTVGERVLGLPPEPRLDKGVAYRELKARERETAPSGRSSPVPTSDRGATG